MPIYEYECSKHGKFEEIRPMEARSIPALCPVCDEFSEQVKIASFSFTIADTRKSKVNPNARQVRG